jgi:nucleoid-associated protein YgaU
MKKIITLGAAAMLAMAAGCNNKGNGANSGSGNLAPAPRPMTAQQTYSPPPAADPNPTFAPSPAVTPTAVDPGPVSAAPASGKKYTVQKGDTLWGIATRTYGSGKDYKKIVAANPSIKNEKISAGQTILLP